MRARCCPFPTSLPLSPSQLDRPPTSSNKWLNRWWSGAQLLSQRFRSSQQQTQKTQHTTMLVCCVTTAHWCWSFGMPGRKVTEREWFSFFCPTSRLVGGQSTTGSSQAAVPGEHCTPSQSCPPSDVAPLCKCERWSLNTSTNSSRSSSPTWGQTSPKRHYSEQHEVFPLSTPSVRSLTL